jgi:DNA-binding NarL/FixJ family response regulator
MVALIVVKRGPLREGLSRLMTSIPGVEIAGETGDLSRAIEMIGKRRPDLVLIDGDLPHSGAWDALQRAKQGWPETRFAILADHCQEIPFHLADAILQKGMPAATLVHAIETLLSKSR